MCQRQAAFGHHLNQVSQAQLEAKIPAHAQDDDLAVKVATLEQLLDAHQLAHAHPSGSSADIIAGQILPLHQSRLGNVGGAVARIGNAFGMKVIAWSQNLTSERAAEVGAKLVSKDELFQQADVVSIHLVLSGRTRGLVGAAELGLMKPTARLINTSRGPIVVEADLVAALKDKKIAGGAIDVFDQEPLPLDHPLRALPNLLATPHIGYVSRGLYERFYRDTVENIARWLDGQAAI